jgi:hypothetical protein
MRSALMVFFSCSLFACKSRDDSSLRSAGPQASGDAKTEALEFTAQAKYDKDKLTFVRTKNAGDFLNMSVVRFADQSADSFTLYGKKVSYPANKSKCVVPGKDYTCERDIDNPKFGERMNFGPALKFVKKTANQTVYQGSWPCSKVVEFVSEKPGKTQKQCLITAKVKSEKKKVTFSVKVKGGFGLTASGVDLDVLPMPFVDQPLQKEVVLAAMKRIRERWPDNAVKQQGAKPLNENMGTQEITTDSTIVACNENFVPWWSDIVVHYYCQFPGMGVRNCFTGSVRGGYGFNYRPYFTPIPGFEGGSMGGAYDFCLHDGSERRTTPFYKRFADVNQIPDDGTRGNYKWLAVTPVVDDNGQQFLNSEGKPITHGDVFEYIMGSGVAIGNDKTDLAAQFDAMSGDLGSKLFTLDAVWQEYAKKDKEVAAERSSVNASATWTDPDANACTTNLQNLKNYRPWDSCRTPADKGSCEAVAGCIWDECGGQTGICYSSKPNLCDKISSKDACVATADCVISSTGSCVETSKSDSTTLQALYGELNSILGVTKKLNQEIEGLKSKLKPIREKMHYNDNYSTVSTFNADDQQWVINKFYNLGDNAAQKVCDPQMNGDKVAGYASAPDGSCCADTRFYRIPPTEGRTAKVRLQRNLNDEKGQRDNNCEKDAQGACLTGGNSGFGGSTNFANVCKPAPLPAGAVINNPEQ